MSKIAVGGMLIGLILSIQCAGAQTPVSTNAPRNVQINVPPDVSDADAQRIQQNVNRFFSLVPPIPPLPPISAGGQVTTPVGGGSVVISVGRSAQTGTSARSADISQFANRSAEDYERDIFKDIACNAAAAAAAAACTGSGPVLAACLAVVEAARQACLH